MHRGSVTSYLLNRGLRISFVVLLFFTIVSLIPFHTDEGEQWRLSHYVYKPKPETPLGYTEEGWKKGYGRLGDPSGKSQEESTAQRNTEDALSGVQSGEERSGTAAADKSKEGHTSSQQEGTGGSKIDPGPTIDGHAIGTDSKAHDQKLEAGVVGTPGKQEASGEPGPYAYVFYATEDAYACSVLVNIDRLQKGFKTKHRIFVLATRDLTKAYLDAFKARGVTVSIQTAPEMPSSSAQYYINCMVKLFAFKMHHIDKSLRRILIIDSDQLILQNLDHLFTTLPEVDLAAPRAYWLGSNMLSSTFMLINLSERTWKRVEEATKTIADDKYDMDIVNDLFNTTAMILTGRYVTINSHWEAWDLPKWWHKEEDWSQLKVEEAIPVDANAEIHGEKVDDVAGHAGHNFHPPPDNAQRHWRRSPVQLRRRFDTLPAEDTKEGVFPKPILRRPHNNADSDQGSDEQESESVTVVDDQPTVPEVPKKEDRPLYKELYQVYPDAAVLHFFALGKPWQWSLPNVIASRPNAHPVFYQQFKEWREAAMESCPGLIGEV
ncbi:nucleotide-diphospho-sugar transferase [Elsinoe ampelina]|uniref:Nucleotide-diphospho-sugar transferase n=1 Tax=Elsinoe ampelina TaxID=302913 RepID=A0A6A6GHD6_9PEZI|nr:nucleotide-diphospho-sugar transferase [Elsinoe ampelina]